MARNSSVYSLPLSVRQELMRRLANGGYGDYLGINAWLAEQGHPISKSALHRFGKQLKEKQVDIQMVEFRTRLVELRMRCVESASQAGAGDVLDSAQKFLDWVLGHA